MATAVADIGAPMFGKVEFFFDRRKSAAVALVAIVTGSVIAYPVATSPVTLSGTAERLAAGVAFSGSAMLLTVGFMLLLRLLFHRGAALVVDAHGILDRRTGAPMLPWTHVHDVRVLDRHGRLIAIEMRCSASNVALPRPRWWPAAILASRVPSLTIVDTFFLQSRSGDRILDFVVPLTALTPIDLSETPISAHTLSADARLARRRTIAVVLFIVGAAVVPAAAAILATA